MMSDKAPLAVLVGSATKLFDRVEQGLGQAGCKVRRYRSEEAFLEASDGLEGANVLYGNGSLPMTRERLARAPDLRAIISPYTGTEGFDEAAASALGILVVNGQIEENFTSMAEATILMILASLYDLAERERAVRTPDSAMAAEARMLAGKTVGILGFGEIARAVVNRLEPWRVRIIAHTRRPDETRNVQFVDLDTLLVDSDILCVLAPFNAQTANLLDAERLARTRRGSVLVVMSRGGIVDERAAADLARTGHFLRVAFDVFAEEPCPRDSPLLGVRNAVLTPHAIGHSSELLARLPEAGIANVLAVLAGNPPPYVRNPAILPAWIARWRAA
ncbi:MAG: D-isomer specific 2-hydroxyacid dehydrogenase, binding domain protein [Bradyrhizobium sp.]|nr:D-isomer specific 2-hydroxyacid dehydrogenase, binding domain protein [Bradyrhizobium sp.]